MSVRKPQALLGFLAGLVTGLAVSGGAALYLTLAPLPFVNKVQQSTEKVTPMPGDPNRPLFSPHIPDAAPATPAAPGPDSASSTVAVPGTSASALPVQPGGADAARLHLQVGAYKNAADADAARAKLALLGLDAKISELQSDGITLYRVRLGPYGKLDDLEGIRHTLSDNGIDAQVVHQK
jgi:cell division protein FtsN